MTTSSSSSATLNSVIDDSIESRLKEVHTCTPGIVQTFNTLTLRAEIQPAIKRILFDGQVITLPKLINCPLGNFKAGGFSITFPVKPGDECMIHFTERSLDAWIQFGDIRLPNDRRILHEKDAYFLPAHTSEKNITANYDADNLVIRNDQNDLKIVLTNSGNLIVDAVSTVTITTSDTIINSDVRVNGALSVRDKVTGEDALEIAGVCDLSTTAAGVNMNGGNVTQVLTTGSINPITGTPYPVGNPKITGDA